MAILPIVTYDDEVLRKEAEPVIENSDELQKLIDDMFETMYNADGVGLAAPQVGRLVRVFVTDADVMADKKEEENGEGEESKEEKLGPIAMINPEIVAESDEQVELEEGCLSIPGVNASITRPENVKVRYLDRDFTEQELQISGWFSRVVQHERDHLDGILFLDHLSLFKRKLLGSRLKEIAEGRRETDYPIVSSSKSATG